MRFEGRYASGRLFALSFFTDFETLICAQTLLTSSSKTMIFSTGCSARPLMSCVRAVLDQYFLHLESKLAVLSDPDCKVVSSRL